MIHRHCEQDDSGILENKRTKTKTSGLDRKKFLTFLHSTNTAASFSRLRLTASNAYRGIKDKEGKVKRSYLLLGPRKCLANHDLKTNMSQYSEKHFLESTRSLGRNLDWMRKNQGYSDVRGIGKEHLGWMI